MIPFCQLYNDFKGTNNTWQQGHFRPLSFEAAVYYSELEIFNALRKEWEQSQIITDALRPYFKRVQVPIKILSVGGIIKYPSDYVSYSGVKYLTKKKLGGKGVLCADIEVLESDKKCRPLREEEKQKAMLTTDKLFEHEITKVDSQRWSSVMDHEFLFPSIDRPYATQDGDGFKIVPEGLGVAILYYLAKPPRAKFDYTKDDQMNFICKPSSGSILLGEEALPELMGRIKSKYASYIGNQQKYVEAEREIKSVRY